MTMRPRLSQRIGIVHALMMAALVATLIVTVLAFQHARDMNTRIRDTHIPSIELTNSLLIQIEQMEDEEFLYFAPGQDIPLHESHFDAAAKRFENSYLQLRPLTRLTDEQQLYARLGQLFGGYVEIDRRMRELIDAGQALEARRLNTANSLANADRMREAARVLHEINLRESQAAAEGTERTLLATGLATLCFILLGAALAGLLWYRTAKDVLGPLADLREATRLLGDGHYQPMAREGAERTEEFHALREDFNRMAAQLVSTTEELREANVNLENQVAERTRQLSAANRRLEANVEELMALDQLKSNFMSIVSHELLTPINFITGYGSALEDGLMGPLVPEQTEAIAKIMEGSDRLTRMVRNVLDYTQLEAGRLPVHPEPFDAAAVLEDVVEALRPAASAKHQRIEVAIDGDLPDAYADPHRTGQLLAELLDNAIKFSPEGRPIRLAAQATEAGLSLEVADRGEGMSEAAMRDLFKPFFQADTTSTRRHGGMGLGLAIARQLAERMGGELVVRSRLGQGTTFRLTLPRADRLTTLAEARREGLNP